MAPKNRLQHSNLVTIRLMLDLKEPSEFRNQILLFWRLTELCFYLCSHRLSPVVHTGTKRSHILYFQKTLALFRTFKILMLLLRKFPNLKSKLNEKKKISHANLQAYILQHH